MNKIVSRIEEASHIVVIAHINPDADSISSASALYTHMLRLHKKVSFFCATKDINPKLSFLPWFDKIRNSFPSSADLAISLDCGSRSRVGVDVECDLINIDHHASNDSFGDINLVDVSCISTTQILYNFFKDNEIKINHKMATALYAGILDDSSGFMDESVDGKIFAIIRELIECGADHKSCNKFLMKYQSLGAFRLKAIMYKNMQLLNEARVAFFHVSSNDMKASGAIGEDCEIALEESLHLPSVEVAVLIKQNLDSTLKCSLRSSRSLDVSKIASVFSGGGHIQRAGFILEAGISVEDAKTKVLKLIYEEM